MAVMETAALKIAHTEMTCKRSHIDATLEPVVQSYERRYGLRFDTITTLSQGSLDRYAAMADQRKWSAVSQEDDEILRCIESMTVVANRPAHSDDDLKAYRAALISIYRRLGIVEARQTRQWALWVAPEREGRALAFSLGCLPSRISLSPNAKRMPTPSGLAVGVAWGESVNAAEHCMIVDGAIASGATLISIIDVLKSHVKEFRIFAAHATEKGLNSLCGYAKECRIDLSIAVGHVSGVLNAASYAVSESNPSMLVVGDLGDLLCGKV